MSALRTATLVLAACALTSCGPDVEHVPATQITARISIGAAVRANMTELRVRCFALKGDGWESGVGRSFDSTEIGDIVDVPFVPRAGTGRDRAFEIIAEALEGGRVLVQERALVTFVPAQQRMREMRLDPCGERSLGDLCEVDPECHGAHCLRCLDAACAPTGLTPGEQLPPLDTPGPSQPLEDGGTIPETPATPTMTPATPDAVTCDPPGRCDAGTPARPMTTDADVAARPDAGAQTVSESAMPPCVVGKTQVGRCALR